MIWLKLKGRKTMKTITLWRILKTITLWRIRAILESMQNALQKNIT